MFVWLDNQVCPAEAALSNPLSAANLLGWGVFTTLAVARSRPLWLSRHCARLRRDGEQINLMCPHDNATIQRACEEIIAANQIENGIARLTLSGLGDGRWRENHGASLLISVLKNKAAPDEIRLWLSPHRMNASRPLCGVKSSSYAPWQWLWQQAQRRGCEEAIYCDEAGNLCEGARSNLFWMNNGEIFTPALACGALPGIGRALILEIAQRENLPVHEGAWPSETLCAAEEIFITNAVTGPRRVVSVIDEESEVFCARENAIVRQLQEFWRAAVNEESA